MNRFSSCYSEIFFSGFSIICQMVFLFFPGKNPMMFYFCHGKMPAIYLDEKFKANHAFNFFALITLILQSTIPAKLTLHKLKQHKEMNPEESNPIRKYVQQRFTKEGLYRYLLFAFLSIEKNIFRWLLLFLVTNFIFHIFL